MLRRELSWDYGAPDGRRMRVAKRVRADEGSWEELEKTRCTADRAR